MTQQSLELSEAAQKKVDHLERLVRSLLESQQSTQGQVETPSSCMDVENDEKDDEADNRSEHESHVEPRTPNQSTTAGQAYLNTPIKIGADYKQSLSIDEAHWALLLNEVRNIGSSQSSR